MLLVWSLYLAQAGETGWFWSIGILLPLLILGPAPNVLALDVQSREEAGLGGRMLLWKLPLTVGEGRQTPFMGKVAVAEPWSPVSENVLVHHRERSHLGAG